MVFEIWGSISYGLIHMVLGSWAQMLLHFVMVLGKITKSKKVGAGLKNGAEKNVSPGKSSRKLQGTQISDGRFQSLARRSIHGHTEIRDHRETFASNLNTSICV